jgi:hypothetical protein
MPELGFLEREAPVPTVEEVLNSKRTEEPDIPHLINVFKNPTRCTRTSPRPCSRRSPRSTSRIRSTRCSPRSRVAPDPRSHRRSTRARRGVLRPARVEGRVPRMVHPGPEGGGVPGGRHLPDEADAVPPLARARQARLRARPRSAAYWAGEAAIRLVEHWSLYALLPLGLAVLAAYALLRRRRVPLEDARAEGARG